MPGFGLGDKVGGNRFNQALENPVLDVNCFSIPAAFIPGNAGRNIITGPGLIYSQVSAKKNFALTERINLQFLVRLPESIPQLRIQQSVEHL